jgi:hypothetical protein
MKLDMSARMGSAGAVLRQFGGRKGSVFDFSFSYHVMSVTIMVLVQNLKKAGLLRRVLVITALVYLFINRLQLMSY